MNTSLAAPRIDVPKTVAHDGSLPFVELDDYGFTSALSGIPVRHL